MVSRWLLACSLLVASVVAAAPTPTASSRVEFTGNGSKCFFVDPPTVGVTEDDFIPRVSARRPTDILEVWAFLHSGGTVNIDVQSCPGNTSCAGITGSTGLSVTTTASFVVPSGLVRLQRGDSLTILINSVTSTPRNLTVCVFYQS